MYYLNPDIENLYRIFDQNKRKGYLRLDLNENPGGLPEEFIREVLSKVDPEFVSQYPETLEFTESLAKYLGTDISHLCLVNGSSEGIRYIIQAYSRPGGRIVCVSPSYAMFEVYAKMFGRDFVPVTYTENLEMPVSRITSELTDDTDLLILVNPNNPMGNVYTDEEMRELIEAAESHEITVLIDEAYHYFCPTTVIDYALHSEHVFVTRTFSKLFSLAGCRLGYVAGWPRGIEMVQKLCTPHNVNAFSMLFAQAVFETPGMVDGLIEKFREGREYLLSELTAHGYAWEGQAGNFLFIGTKTDADEIVRRMKEEKGILIKAYRGIGKLGTCLRVTTGEKQYMESFLKALFELDR